MLCIDQWTAPRWTALAHYGPYSVPNLTVMCKYISGTFQEHFKAGQMDIGLLDQLAMK